MRVPRVILSGFLGLCLVIPAAVSAGAADSAEAGWGRVVNLAGPSSDWRLPAVAVDSKGNSLAVWLDADQRHAPLMAVSRPHGGTWSRPRAVPDSDGASEVRVAFDGRSSTQVSP